MPNLTPIPPAIDYTNKDYVSCRQAMLDLARYRLPEWTDHSAADPGVLLVDSPPTSATSRLLSGPHRQRSVLATAAERRSILHLLRLIGYQLICWWRPMPSSS